jgi:hypothetical protein
MPGAIAWHPKTCRWSSADAGNISRCLPAHLPLLGRSNTKQGITNMDNAEATGAYGYTIINSTWGHKKFKLRNKFRELNDADLNYVVGQERELVARLQARLNMTEAAVQQLIDSL